MPRRYRGVVGGVLAGLAGAGVVSAGVVSAAAAPASADVPGLVEGGPVPYVLGATAETGPIFGGVHLLMIPSAGGREPINRANVPERLHPWLRGAAMTLRPEIREGEAEQELFASSWWPMRDNGIAARWRSRVRDYQNLTADPDNLSPVEKYDLLFYPGRATPVPEVRNWPYEDMELPEGERGAPRVHPGLTVAGPATAWELVNHGVYQDVFPEGWWGHCNGWASYTVAEPGGAPRRDVRVKLAGGTPRECAAGEAGCVLFRMGDIEALLTEVYYSDAATIAGQRCDVDADMMERDEFGRPTLPGCRDVNPATLHVALTGLLGAGAPPLGPSGGGSSAPPQRLAFVLDQSWDREVWNFPVKRFAIDEIEDVGKQHAMYLVCEGGEANLMRCVTYRMNENATRFARVKARFWMISDDVFGESLLLPAAERGVPLREVELDYVLEMDGAGRILGGEWIRDPQVSDGAGSKEMHPDFLWLPVRPQSIDEDSDDRGGQGDNPHIAYSQVKALLALSTAPPASP